MILGIRPEHLEDASLARDTPPDRRLRGHVELREALGSELMVHFSVEGAQPAETEETKELARDTGAGESGLADARTRSSSAASARARTSTEGEPVEVAVDTSALHFFDPETGLGIYDQARERSSIVRSRWARRAAVLLVVVAAGRARGREQRVGRDEARRSAVSGQHHLRRGLDRAPRQPPSGT